MRLLTVRMIVVHMAIVIIRVASVNVMKDGMEDPQIVHIVSGN